MYKETESLRNIHKIQGKIHKETKQMNVDEKVTYFNKKAEEAEKKWGFHLRKITHV